MQIGLNLNRVQGNQLNGGIQASQGAQQAGGGQHANSQNHLKSLGLDPSTASNGFQQAQKFFGGAQLQ